MTAPPTESAPAPVAPHGAIGVALSGGGSRAAAFHVGTIRALAARGLLASVDRFSCCSGGSVFGALYDTSPHAAAIDRLDAIQAILRKGVVRITPSIVLAALAGGAAERLERALLDEHGLHHRVASDLLVLHAACLTDGKMAKFYRGKISKHDYGRDLELPPEWNLARQVTASAAFPLLIPPLTLRRAPKDEEIELTDGGVLDNLAVETLVLGGSRHRRFRLVVSDGEAGPLRSADAVLGALLVARFPKTTARILALQSAKGMRGARALVVQQQLLHRMKQQTLTDKQLADLAPDEPRSLVMVRVNETWDGFFEHRSLFTQGALASKDLAEIWGTFKKLGGAGGCDRHPDDSCQPPAETDTASNSPCLERRHARLAQLRQIGTNFIPLSDADVDDLAIHAEWQVYAQLAAYGPL